jgi:hypothetical protein
VEGRERASARERQRETERERERERQRERDRERDSVISVSLWIRTGSSVVWPIVDKGGAKQSR